MGPMIRTFSRITVNPAVMGGRPCIRGMRVTVSMVLNQLASGQSMEQVLEAYPYLQRDDLLECLAFAASRVEEAEVVLAA